MAPPAPQQDHKTAGGAAPLDDLDLPIAERDKHMTQPRPAFADQAQQHQSPAAVLHVGQMHHGTDHQAKG